MEEKNYFGSIVRRAEEVYL